MPFGTILAIDGAGNVFGFNPADPSVKSWPRPRRPTDKPFARDAIYLVAGQWYAHRVDLLGDAFAFLHPLPAAPSYARYQTREQARDWFLAAEMPLPDELADLRPACEPTPEAPADLPAADEVAAFLPLHMAAKGVGLEESQLSTLCKSGSVASREPTEGEKELYGGKIKRMVSVPDAHREAAQRRGQFRGSRKPLGE